MMDKYFVDFVKPERGTLQNIYIGECGLRDLNLIPGDVLLVKNQFIGRCFLNRIREMCSIVCENCVHIQQDDRILLQPPLPAYKSILKTEIRKLTTTTVSSIAVDVILDRKGVEISSDVLRDVLHGVCFMNNSLVFLEDNPVGKLYNLVALRISTESAKPDEGYELEVESKISVKNIFTKSYIETMAKNSLAVEIGGVKTVFQRLKKTVKQRNQHTLLSGPSGAGKSCLTARLAADLGLPLVVQDCSEVGVEGDVLEKVFEKADEVCDQHLENPGTILLLKNVDTLGGRKGIHQLQSISLLTSLLEKHKAKDNNIIVVATTSRPEYVDLNLRRPGRLGVEIFMKVPDEDERLDILRCVFRNIKLNIQDQTLVQISRSTRGYLASDLALLAKRILRSNTDNWKSIQKCIDITVPSGLKQGLGWVNLQKITWESIGGMEEIKTKLIRSIEWPIRKPEAFKRLGIKPSKGILLYGPPGCGKTRLVRAAASNVGATLLSVCGAEIYSPYVGDSEKAIVELFRQARLGAPTILFIDEIDTLVSARDMEGSKTNHSDKVLSALLTEMDGMGGKEQENTSSGQVLVVGATNRPGCLDSALTRPGRLDTLLYVPPPDPETRLKILETYLKKVPKSDLDLQIIVERTESFSGADLENLIKEAVLHLLSKEGMSAKELRMENIESVLSEFRPSLPSSLNEYMMN